MIVPASRLLRWTALVVVPLATVIGMLPTTALEAGVLLLGFVAFTAADAWRGRLAFAGVSVKAPPLVRLSMGKPGSFELRVRGFPQGKRLRLGLDFPPALSGSQADIWAQLPVGVQESVLDWPCIGTRRGSHRLQQCRLEWMSPWSFWAVRRVVPLEAEFRVFPDLHADRKSLAPFLLRRTVTGMHVRRQIGKGREFEKLREYIPGDGYEDIHWKATARRGHPITKVFQIERNQELYVVLDASRLSGRPVGETGQKLADSPASGEAEHPPPAVLERYISAALVLGLAAEKQGDSFGLVAFSSRIQRFLRAAGGKRHFGRCRDALYTLETEPLAPDFEELSTSLRLRLRRRALLIFLTDLSDPVLAEHFLRDIELIRRRHLVVVNMLRPSGVQPLFSDPNVKSSDELYEALGGHLRWHKLRELEKQFRRRGMRFSLLDHENLSLQLTAQYLEVKQGQRL
ncbi:MAG: DUF58 domain-containing protein [Acidobacteriota bacterium]